MIQSDYLPLYQRLEAYNLDNELTGYGLTKRLAKENQWTIEYSEEAIAEYKKLAFLAVVCDHPITPSKPLDQVWHLHLIYSYCYWEQFCPNILNYRWHHHPGTGDQAENLKYEQQYQQTLDSYRYYFNEDPPRHIWGLPEDAKVLGEKKVNFFQWKPLALCLISFSLIILGGCTTSNPLDYSGRDFLSFYITFGILDFLCSLVLRLTLPQLKICQETGLSRWIPATLMFLLGGLGVAKILVGMSRGKPVDTLTTLTAIVGVIGWLFLHPRKKNQSRRRSSSGDNGKSCPMI